MPGATGPSANAHQKTKSQTHVCAIIGGGLLGYFLVLQKVTRLHRRTPSGFIRHYFACAQGIGPRPDLDPASTIVDSN